jgi:hypothetical protein
MPQYAQQVIDDYLTAMWSDDPSAERRADSKMKDLIFEFGRDIVEAWAQERSKLIYGTN